MNLHPVSKIQGTWVSVKLPVVLVNLIHFNIFRKTVSMYLNVPCAKPCLDHIERGVKLEVRKWITLKKVHSLREIIIIFNYVREIGVSLATDVWKSLYLGAHRVWTFIIDQD